MSTAHSKSTCALCGVAQVDFDGAGHWLPGRCCQPLLRDARERVCFAMTTVTHVRVDRCFVVPTAAVAAATLPRLRSLAYSLLLSVHCSVFSAQASRYVVVEGLRTSSSAHELVATQRWRRSCARPRSPSRARERCPLLAGACAPRTAL